MIDALAARGTVFERAYTFWPKTRASMICMMTGLYPSKNGYDQRHRQLHGFNPTLASVLQGVGFETAAFVDNANVAGDLGFSKGFGSFEEMWTVPERSEADNARRITEGARHFLAEAPRDRPFFLWLHYVNPHGPYTPPPPFDRRFEDEAAESGPDLEPVTGFYGGIRRPWAVPGRTKLGYYVAQYDGEIAFTDGQVGRVLEGLEASGRDQETVIVLTSDHGESLGEHDYYFDHGADLFDPCLHVPLIVVSPEGRPGLRTDALASTLDVVPTVLDAVKVRYPPDLAGLSLLPVVTAGAVPPRSRLFAENDRGHVGTHDGRHKLIGEPYARGGYAFALYDRDTDPAELRDVKGSQPGVLAEQRAALEAFLKARSREWRATAKRLGNSNQTESSSPDCSACLQLRALGYVESCPAECGP